MVSLCRNSDSDLEGVVEKYALVLGLDIVVEVDMIVDFGTVVVIVIVEEGNY